MMNQESREMRMTRRLMAGTHRLLAGGNDYTNRDVAVSSTGVGAAAGAGAAAPAILNDRLATPESKLEALLQTIPAGLARAIMARKDSLIEKISAAMKFFQG